MKVGVREMTTRTNNTTPKSKSTGKLIFKVPIIVEFDVVNYHSYSPALKGLHMDGETEKEALENAREAAREFLEIMIQEGRPIPLIILSWEEAQKLPDYRQKEGYYEEEITIKLK
jgi:predicted RNase H-like HicB family nuclease